MSSIIINNEQVNEKVKNYPVGIVEYVSPDGADKYYEVNSGFMAEEMINTLEIMYKWTKVELKNYFTFEEVWCIIRAFQSTIYNPTSIKPKELLVMQVEDCFIYEPHDEHSLEGIKTVQDKIKNLSQFQAYTFLMLYYEFQNNNHEIFISNDKIKKAFLIEE